MKKCYYYMYMSIVLIMIWTEVLTFVGVLMSWLDWIYVLIDVGDANRVGAKQLIFFFINLNSHFKMRLL